MSNGQKLYLVGIDVQPTDNASQRITTTMNLLKRLNPPVSHFVLNASFAMVPCKLKNYLKDYLTDHPDSIAHLPEDLLSLYKALQKVQHQHGEIISTTQITRMLASGLAMRFANLTLNQSSQLPIKPCESDYKKMWASAPYSIYQEDAQIFSNTLTADPLIKTLQGGAEIVTVAASGNADFGFPFAPAQFPSIISTNGGELQSNDSCSEFTTNSAQWLVTSDNFTYPNTNSKVKIIPLCLNLAALGCAPELFRPARR